MAVISMALLLVFCTYGQDPVVIRDYGGKRVVDDPSRYKLTGASEHKVIIQHYELISSSERDQLIDLIIQDIDYYLDRVMQIDDGKMIVRKSDKQILKDLESIIDHKIKLYDYQVDEAFAGFSEKFNEKIKNIERLNWSTESVNDPNSAYDGRALALNYVQSQIGELKEISTNELRLFAEDHIHELTGLEIPEDLAFDPGPIDTGEWVLNSPLIPIDFSLATIAESDIGLFLEPESATTQIPEETDDRIVKLLESNNELIRTFGEQMIAMQQEMLDIRRESLAYQEEFRDIRTEIGDLQLAITEIQESNSAVLQNPRIRPLETEDSYIVRFDKNSDHISISYQMELNEVYHLLMLDPNRKVMITGFADISGTPELNAEISRMRALSVKYYLRKKGVPSNRMIINFVGDSVSKSENPMDRKVEIAWLGN
ncbi:MAG: OmpA family protein [Flavobacteriales bacterium]|nr:OmpA family protein [Flavobacteriales bacterium]